MWILNQPKRDPALLVKKTIEKLENMSKCANDAAKLKKAEESLKKYLTQLKSILAEKQNPVLTATLAGEIARTNFIDVVVETIPHVDFDSRKDLSIIFVGSLQYKIGQTSSVCTYLTAHPQLIGKIIELHKNSETINAASSMFRALCEHQDMVKLILSHKMYSMLYEYSGMSEFSISSNSQENFRHLYTNNSQLFCSHIEKSDGFFREYFAAIQTLHHLAKDNFAEILVDILESRFCIDIVNEFINNKENLKSFLMLFEERKPFIKFKMTKILERFVQDSTEVSVKHLLEKNKYKIVALLMNLASGMNASTDKNELEGFISYLEQYTAM